MLPKARRHTEATAFDADLLAASAVVVGCPAAPPSTPRPKACAPTRDLPCAATNPRPYRPRRTGYGHHAVPTTDALPSPDPARLVGTHRAPPPRSGHSSCACPCASCFSWASRRLGNPGARCLQPGGQAPQGGGRPPFAPRSTGGRVIAENRSAAWRAADGRSLTETPVLRLPARSRPSASLGVLSETRTMTVRGSPGRRPAPAAARERTPLTVIRAARAGPVRPVATACSASAVSSVSSVASSASPVRRARSPF